MSHRLAGRADCESVAASPATACPRGPARPIHSPPETFVTFHHRYVLLALVLLAACGSDESASAGGSAIDSTGAPDLTDTAAARDSASAVPAAASATIVLAPDGLELPGSGSAAKLAFGTGRAQVLAAVSGVLGAPTEQG